MSRVTSTLLALALLSAATARPVRRTLNFNMFVLQPKHGNAERILLSTNGISRFGPILEYLVQRVQGMMSVKLGPHPSTQNFPSTLPISVQDGPDTSENEVDGNGNQDTRVPGVVVRPSASKPGTYEVEINVVVDDGQPEDHPNHNHV